MTLAYVRDVISVSTEVQEAWDMLSGRVLRKKRSVWEEHRENTE